VGKWIDSLTTLFGLKGEYKIKERNQKQVENEVVWIKGERVENE